MLLMNVLHTPTSPRLGSSVTDTPGAEQCSGHKDFHGSVYMAKWYKHSSALNIYKNEIFGFINNTGEI